MSNSNLEQEPEPEDSRNNTIFETRDSLIVDQEDNSRNMSRWEILYLFLILEHTQSNNYNI